MNYVITVFFLWLQLLNLIYQYKYIFLREKVFFIINISNISLLRTVIIETSTMNWYNLNILNIYSQLLDIRVFFSHEVNPKGKCHSNVYQVTNYNSKWEKEVKNS